MRQVRRGHPLLRPLHRRQRQPAGARRRAHRGGRPRGPLPRLLHALRLQCEPRGRLCALHALAVSQRSHVHLTPIALPPMAARPSGELAARQCRPRCMLKKRGPLPPLFPQTPDGTDVSEFWTWIRGADGLRLRGEPASQPARSRQSIIAGAVCQALQSTGCQTLHRVASCCGRGQTHLAAATGFSTPRHVSAHPRPCSCV